MIVFVCSLTGLFTFCFVHLSKNKLSIVMIYGKRQLLLSVGWQDGVSRCAVFVMEVVRGGDYFLKREEVGNKVTR